jgi:uncharacterized protein YndB with AHSA1/START domain
MSDPLIVRVSRAFRAPAERVFDAWLDPALAGRFLFATPDGTRVRVEIDARVGGWFHIDERRGDELAMHFGEYRVIDRPRRLVFTFATDPAEPPSLVTIEITPTDDGCELTLTHEIDAKWAEWAERTRDGWAGMLGGLGSVLGAGAAAQP